MNRYGLAIAVGVLLGFAATARAADFWSGAGVVLQIAPHQGTTYLETTATGTASPLCRDEDGLWAIDTTDPDAKYFYANVLSAYLAGKQVRFRYKDTTPPEINNSCLINGTRVED